MAMYIEIAQFAWNVLFGVGTLVALVWTWTLRRSAADAKSLVDLEKKLSKQDAAITKGVSDLDVRLGRVEERVNHLPTDHDITDVREALAKLGAQMSDLSGEQRATTRLVERINQYLMERER